MNTELKAFLSGGFKNFFGASDEWTNQVWEGIKEDPWRILFPFDQVGTKVSNALLGRNDEPLGGALGGPTADQLNAVDPDGTPRYTEDEKNAAQAGNVIIPLIVGSILTGGALSGGAGAGAGGGGGGAGGAGGSAAGSSGWQNSVFGADGFSWSNEGLDILSMMSDGGNQQQPYNDAHAMAVERERQKRQMSRGLI